MSKRWPGGIVTKTQATPTGPFEDGAAPGIWTLNQMTYWVKQALWPTAGIPNPSRFIENLFSTYLYTGNGSTQTITNGIDLSGKGGMTWLKSRSAATDNFLFDTARGALNEFNSNNTDAQASLAASLTAFNATGFSLGAAAGINVNAATYVSWTFRKQPKFFDVVTYTGDGVAGRQIAHSLGSAPGCIIVKCTSIARDWAVWQNTLSNGTYLKLNTTDSVITNTSFQVFGDASGQTSSVFTVGKSGAGVHGLTNANGDTYVAYLFAHNAGGFGLTGNDNVISCGSYTGTGANPGPIINLGYEPQWVMIRTLGTGYWEMYDNMRGLPSANSPAPELAANISNAEGALFGGGQTINALSNGFQINTTATDTNAGGQTFIYIAIRRGPMAVPTTGTSVFSPVSATPSGATTVTTNFPVDLAINAPRSVTGNKTFWDRLRGSSTATGQGLFSNLTNAEVSYGSNGIGLQSNTTIVDNFWNSLNGVTTPVVYWNMRRAPGFFDVVCYTGTGVARTINHNLTVAPELMIVKQRSAANQWGVYYGNTARTLFFSLDSAYQNAGTDWNSTAPTASVFSVGTGTNFAVNNSGQTYVAYLFASIANVSKVGTYTGTGATQTINAGLASGARFVMIKRTDSTGDWFTWDTARGMVAGTDPSTKMNTTAVESNANWVYTVSTGFQIVTTDATVNASGGTYIYLAIA